MQRYTPSDGVFLSAAVVSCYLLERDGGRGEALEGIFHMIKKADCDAFGTFVGEFAHVETFDELFKSMFPRQAGLLLARTYGLNEFVEIARVEFRMLVELANRGSIPESRYHATRRQVRLPLWMVARVCVLNDEMYNALRKVHTW